MLRTTILSPCTLEILYQGQSYPLVPEEGIGWGRVLGNNDQKFVGQSILLENFYIGLCPRISVFFICTISIIDLSSLSQRQDAC